MLGCGARPTSIIYSSKLPHREKVNWETKLSEGYQITICFDMGFKSMNAIDVKSVCVARLNKMGILLRTDYAGRA